MPPDPLTPAPVCPHAGEVERLRAQLAVDEEATQS